MNFQSYNSRYEIYEKSYYHELEAREKINARLIVPLSMLTSLSAALAFLIPKTLPFLESESCGWDIKDHILFALILFLSASFSYSVYLFKSAWSGHEYRFTPTAAESERYWLLLQETYADYEDKDKLIEQYFCEYYCTSIINSASQNKQNNAIRSATIHATSNMLFLTIVITISCFILISIKDVGNVRQKAPTASTAPAKGLAHQRGGDAP